MKLWEVDFLDGTRAIVFAYTRTEIWGRYFGIYQIHEVVIH